EALVAGMVEHLMKNYIESSERNAKEDTSQHGRWTRSFIRGSFEQSTPDKHMNAGLMAAAAVNRELSEPVQDAYDLWKERIYEYQLVSVYSTSLRLVVDGVWFSEIFDLSLLEKDHRQRVLERLITLTKKEA